MSKLFVTTDSNRILTMSFSKEEILGDKELLNQEDTYKDNEYLKLNILELDCSGTILEGQNSIAIVCAYNQPLKAFVNNTIEAIDFRNGLAKNCDEDNKYKTKYFVVMR